MNEVDELIDEVLRDVRVDTDTEEETNIPERTEANRFGTIPIHQQRSGIKTPIEQEGKKKIKAKILAIYNKVDVSPLTIDIITDDDTPTDLTMVLWEIDNQTDNTIRYGNSAITYVLDDRLKINPTSDVVWEPERIGPTWNRAPTSGHYTDIEPGVKTRWVGLVDIPDSSKLDLVILNSRDHKPMAFDLSDEHFADESNLPY